MAFVDSPSFPSFPPKQYSTFEMSSSPLPSLADLIQKRPTLIRSGSRATPIPDNATATFTTAASLLKGSTTTTQSIEAIRNFMLDGSEDTKGTSAAKDTIVKTPRKVAAKKTAVVKDKVAKAPRKAANVSRDNEDGVGEGDVKPKKVAKPRARKVAPVEDGEAGETTPVTRKPRAKKVNKDATATDAPPKEKPARKPRAKKVKDDSQPKLAQGKVTKASSKPKTAASKRKVVDDAAKVDPFTDPAGFGLTDAVKRRLNWTPPRPHLTSNPSLDTPANTNTLDDSIALGASVASADDKQGFTNLLGNFGFTTTGEPIVKKSPAQISRKRKLIELMKTNVSVAGAVSPVKEKAPKKKRRTITEQATSAYRVIEESDLPATSAPILQYLELEPGKATGDDVFKIPLKPRTRSPVKAQKSKNGSAQAPILLSPESALKQARNQDYVFGTSSQLAREESPTLLQDLHAAMQASNEADNFDPFFDDLVESNLPTKSSKLVLAANRNLWSAASRDAGGELMEVDILDLAHSSPAVERTSKPKPIAAVPIESSVQEGWHDIDAMNVSLPPNTRPATVTAQDHSIVVADVPIPTLHNEDWHDIEAMDVNVSAEKQSEMVVAQTQSKTLVALPTPESIQEDWPDIEAMESALPAKQPAKQLAEKRGPIETAILELLSSPGGNVVVKRSSTKLLVARDADVGKKDSSKPRAAAKSTIPKGSKMPDFSSYPTAKLEKEIKAYGFKPVKGRNSMIALMEQCWEAKHGSVLESLDPNTSMITPASSKPPPSSQAVAKSPGKPRGRPKKTAVPPSPAKAKKATRKKADNTVEGLEMDSDTPLSQLRTPNKASKKRKGPPEEIEDSDGLLTPSPPRRQGSQAGTVPASLQLSGDNDADLPPDVLEKLLFTHITRAVKDASAATNSHSPSWHEKILLFDPIVLEDLTVWLNTGALEEVGWDGEVEPKEVKKWCESKSICCLWKESLRNGSRSRY